ncbi:tyrosine-protein phosphatase non-receptor type 18 isoform X1 [Oryzias melastigma]|uniref:tyrosine-protein phosphatase non-receptor type 18 isoform X1 n=1 Tax=Oryzias melastigma TaxID=30732 RepID=UPI000CF7CB3B|nr:tyrosine-protein phosphatase non-receptor type 18 isoform X1 [Oryzias melastigma]
MELLPSLLSALKTRDPRSVEQEFNVLRSESLQLKKQLGLTSEVGAQKENIKKNRYKDILPYDQCRVVLSQSTTESSSDYINASFIRGVTGDCRYVACQGPLGPTLVDFWRMIWQLDIKVIVMACREIEMGKKKCECYWASAQRPAAFGPFTISSQGETHMNPDVVVRALTVSFQQETRSVVQYQFVSWPDHDVPYETDGVLDLLRKVRGSQGPHSSPLLVHCSAGCGRTGVICALDYINDLLVSKKITADFSILKVVLDLRMQRPSAVQTKDQYQFIFTAVISMFEQLLQPSPHHLYCNSSELKRPEKTTPITPTSPHSSSSTQRPVMNDTYAVVNKPKKSHPPPSGHTPTPAATPTSSSGSRSLPFSHHYDNEPSGASAAPIYSTVKPKLKPHSLPPSATPIYDIAKPSRQSWEGREYHLTPADSPSPAEADHDYEIFSSAGAASSCSPAGIGFNCRVPKPKGPRSPPAQWSRLER